MKQETLNGKTDYFSNESVALSFEFERDGVVSLPIEQVSLADRSQVDEGLLIRLSFGILESVQSVAHETDSEEDELVGGDVISGWAKQDDRVAFNPEKIREDFYRRYNDVDERTLLLFPDYKKMMLATGKNLKLMSSAGLNLFNAIHKGQDKTGPFNMTFSDLLRHHDYMITMRSVFETKPGPIADAIALSIRRRVGEYAKVLGVVSESFPFIELGTGAGSTTIALAKNIPGLPRLEVLTLEKEQAMHELLLHNLRLPIPEIEQYREMIKPSIHNVVDFLRHINGITPKEFGRYKTSGIFADPPWRAAFASKDVVCSNLREMFFISSRGELKYADDQNLLREMLQKVEANKKLTSLKKLEYKYDLWTAEDIISWVFAKNIAPFIAFPVPSKGFDFDSIKVSAKRLNAHAETIRYHGNDGARQLNEVMVIFHANPLKVEPIIFESDITF